jgi:hypothetical protein
MAKTTWDKTMRKPTKWWQEQEAKRDAKLQGVSRRELIDMLRQSVTRIEQLKAELRKKGETDGM